jgi:hypothetical protein
MKESLMKQADYNIEERKQLSGAENEDTDDKAKAKKTYVENAHASGDGSLGRSDENNIAVSTETKDTAKDY